MGTLVFQANLGGAVNLNGPNIASTVNFTLPSADGTNGQALVTNGSGTLSFATISTAAATPTVLGTVYGKMTASGASPYLTAAGYNAGTNTTGIHNTVVGYNVLNTNTTGTYNTGVGSQALASATGSRNTAVGATVMRVTTGSENVGIGTEDGSGGYSPFWSNTSGSNNIAIGNGGLGKNTTGSNNTATGHMALYNNTTANGNTAVGYQAGYSNQTGTLNTSIGYQANYSATGNYNTSVGYQAGQTITTGTRNTIVGTTAGAGITTGQFNTYVGMDTGAANGSNNVGVGMQALQVNSAGNSTGVGWKSFAASTTGVNTGLGYSAGLATTTGDSNTAIGFRSFENNSTGSSNASLGHMALFNNTTANYNTAVGYQSLYSNTIRGDNVAIGYQALYSNTDTVQNVAVGNYAGYGVTTGTSQEGNNVFVGFNAGRSVSTGYRITAIGTSAGYGGTALTTGNSCTYIGYNAQASSASVSGELVVTSAAVAGKGANTGYINGNGGGTYQGNNSASWSTTSDRRLKKNIVDNNIGLEKLIQVQVRNFEYRLPEEVDPELKPTDAIQKSGVQLGVIAQELQQVLPDCVKQESTGVLSVDPDNLTWYTINAIKQLKAELDAAKAEIATLKGN